MGEGSRVAASCSVGHRCSLDPGLLWLWHRPAALIPIQLLAWELPYAAGAALKRKMGGGGAKAPNSHLNKEDIQMANKHEKYSVRELQIKTSYRLTPIRKSKTLATPNAERMQSTEMLIPCEWECKMVQPPWKTVRQFLSKQFGSFL